MASWPHLYPTAPGPRDDAAAPQAAGCRSDPSLAGYELDIYWPELRFAVELDVYATHGAHEPFEEDRRRDEDLKLAGVELTRVTGRPLEREPRQVMERVALLLDQRREQLGDGGWGR